MRNFYNLSNFLLPHSCSKPIGEAAYHSYVRSLLVLCVVLLLFIPTNIYSKTIYLDVREGWKNDNAYFQILGNGNVNNRIHMTQVDGEEYIYQAECDYTNIRFERCSPNWEFYWNYSVQMDIPQDKNLFKVTDWNDDGKNCQGEWSEYEVTCNNPRPNDKVGVDYYIAGEKLPNISWNIRSIKMNWDCEKGVYAYTFKDIEADNAKKYRFKINPSTGDDWSKQLNSKNIDNEHTDYANLTLRSDNEDDRITFDLPKKSNVTIYTDGTNIWASSPCMEKGVQELTNNYYLRGDLWLDANGWIGINERGTKLPKFVKAADNKSATLKILMPNFKIRFTFWESDTQKSNSVFWDANASNITNSNAATTGYDNTIIEALDATKLITYTLTKVNDKLHLAAQATDPIIKKDGWHLYVDGNEVGTTTIDGEVIVENLAGEDHQFYFTDGSESSDLRYGVNMFGGLYVDIANSENSILSLKQYYKSSSIGEYLAPIISTEGNNNIGYYNPIGRIKLSETKNVKFTFDGEKITVNIVSPEIVPSTDFYLIGDFLGNTTDWSAVKDQAPKMEPNAEGTGVEYTLTQYFKAGDYTRFRILRGDKTFRNAIGYEALSEAAPAPDGIIWYRESEYSPNIKVDFTKAGYLTLGYSNDGKVYAKYATEQFYILGKGENNCGWTTKTEANELKERAPEWHVYSQTFSAVSGKCTFRVENADGTKTTTLDATKTEGVVCTEDNGDISFNLPVPMTVTVYTNGEKVWVKVPRQTLDPKKYYLQGDYNGWHTWNDDFKLTKIDDYTYTITKTWKYEDMNPNYQKCDQKARCKIVPTSDDNWNDQWNKTHIDAATSQYTSDTDCETGDTRIVINLEKKIKEITFYIWKNAQGEQKITVIERPATPEEMVVEPSASITLTQDTYVRDFIFKAEQGQSGQLFNQEKLYYENAYFQLKLTKGDCPLNDQVWYNFSVPFDVDLQHGVYHINADGTTGVPLTYNTDYRVWAWDGSKRADTGNGWVRATGSTIEAGKNYLIGFADGWNTQETSFRFKAKDNVLSSATTIAVGSFPAKSEKNSHWNALGNPTLRHIKVDGNFAQVCEVVGNTTTPTYAFSPVDLRSTAIAVGTAFFCQGTETLAILDAADATALRAPQRSAERLVYDVEILRNGEMNNRLYVTATDDATSYYEQGRDMASWNAEFNTVATIWIDAYGQQLSVCDAPLSEDTISYSMGIHAPYAGEYVLHSAAQYPDAQLDLLYNGQPIARLSDADYTLLLTQGTTHQYSLRIIRHANRVATGMTEITGNTEVVKFIRNGMLVISINGVLYDATGRKIM